MNEPKDYYILIFLDDKRIGRLKGTVLENKIIDMFGGVLKALILKIPTNYATKILNEFPRARVDARGFIEELPITLKRFIFKEILKEGDFNSKVLDHLLENLTKIKAMSEKEEEYLPPPEI